MTSLQKRLLLILGILVVLSPLGIILPELFRSGNAWGEWDIDTIKEMLGFIPEGMKRLSDIWKAPVPDYNLAGEDASMIEQILSYIISGILGVLLVMAVIFLLMKSNRRLKN